MVKSKPLELKKRLRLVSCFVQVILDSAFDCLQVLRHGPTHRLHSSLVRVSLYVYKAAVVDYRAYRWNPVCRWSIKTEMCEMMEVVQNNKKQLKIIQTHSLYPCGAIGINSGKKGTYGGYNTTFV